MKLFTGLLRFEWRYHTRQVTFYAASAAVAAGAFQLVVSGYGPPNVNINSPYVATQALGLVSLMCVFVLTIFCANAALRDSEHGMSELVFVTPIGKPRYIVSRFLGALLASITVMTIAALLMMAAPLMPGVDPTRVGSVQPLTYAWAMLVMVMPNLILIAALLFAVAVMSRSTLATYVGAVAIYALYLVCSLLVESPLMAGAAPPTAEGLARAALLDPFGLSAFFEQTRYWTPIERNTRLPALTGHMLMNRALWLAIAGLVFGLTYRVFAFRSTTRGVRVRRHSRTAPAALTARAPAYQPVAVSEPRALPVLVSSIRLQLRHVLRGWTFLALLALWAFVALMQCVGELAGGDYGTRIIATTGTMVNAMHLPLMLVATIAMVYYAAEIIWRDRAVHVDSFVDATPVSSAVLYLARLVALCTLPLIMTVTGIVVGVLVQVANGYPRIDVLLYLSMLWFAGVPLVLFGVAAIGLQVILPNRWLGMLAGFALAIVARFGAALGIGHPMLRFSASPRVDWSEMSGLDGAQGTFAAFMCFWLAVAVVLGVISWAMWRRGADTDIRARSRAAMRNGGARGLVAITMSVAAAMLVGAALLWQTKIAHGWTGTAEQMQWRASYERKYRRLENAPEPTLVGVRTAVDLFPSAHRAGITGVYTLENRTAQAIDTFWVSLPSDATIRELRVAEATAVRDDAYQMAMMVLPRSLFPGQHAELRFDLVIDLGGIRATDPTHELAGNGAFLTSVRAYPRIGYRSGYEISDERKRRELGLTQPPTQMAALDTTTGAGLRAPNQAWFTLDAVVSTEADQTAFVGGTLDSSWTANGRRYFHYVTEGPTTPIFVITSARYAVRRTTHGSMDIEVWYDADHAMNVPRVMDAAGQALDVFSSRFGRYPFRSLRILETPAWSSFGGFALPGMIYFRETGGFLNDASERDAELITRRTAHEVSHQWWGHHLDPADVEGQSTLIETLAKYSEQLVVSKVHGDAALGRLLAFDEDRYLAGRALERQREPTLMDARGGEYMYYGKGAIVMNGLRDLLGEASVDAALARLTAVHGGPSGHATTADLRSELRAEAHAATQRQLVDEWLGGHTLYDMRVDTVHATRLPGGRFRVRARIRAQKLVSRNGVDRAEPLNNEEIDVVIYDPAQVTILYRRRHVPMNGRINIDVELQAPPGHVVVDAFYRRIDRTRSDNSKRIVMQ